MIQRGDFTPGGQFGINPGAFRHQVRIEERTIASQDSYGQDVYTWTSVITLWCEVRALLGRELELAKQLHAEARFKIRTHFPPAVVKREMRAVWGERILDILDAEDPAGERREFVMYAREWAE